MPVQNELISRIEEMDFEANYDEYSENPEIYLALQPMDKVALLYAAYENDMDFCPFLEEYVNWESLNEAFLAGEEVFVEMLNKVFEQVVEADYRSLLRDYGFDETNRITAFATDELYGVIKDVHALELIKEFATPDYIEEVTKEYGKYTPSTEESKLFLADAMMSLIPTVEADRLMRELCGGNSWFGYKYVDGQLVEAD